jgi:hypothetical protein
VLLAEVQCTTAAAASPAVALIMSGKPTTSATASASFSSAIRPSEPGTVGTPAFCNTRSQQTQQQVAYHQQSGAHSHEVRTPAVSKTQLSATPDSTLQGGEATVTARVRVTNCCSRLQVMFWIGMWHGAGIDKLHSQLQQVAPS